MVLENERLEEISELLKALAHPTRLKIVSILISSKQCVKNLSEMLEASQPNISQHLNILRSKGIVGCKRDGSVVCYYIKDPSVIKLYELLIKEVYSWQEK